MSKKTPGPGQPVPWPLRPVKTLIPGVPGLKPTELILECGHKVKRPTASVSQLPAKARCPYCWRNHHP